MRPEQTHLTTCTASVQVHATDGWTLSRIDWYCDHVRGKADGSSRPAPPTRCAGDGSASGAVLRVVSAVHIRTADQIEESVRAEIGAVSRQGCLRRSRGADREGLIRRIPSQPDRSGTIRRTGSDDNHLRPRSCRRCGQSPPMCRLCSLGLRHSSRRQIVVRFVVDEAEVIIGALPCLPGS